MKGKEGCASEETSEKEVRTIVAPLSNAPVETGLDARSSVTPEVEVHAVELTAVSHCS